MTDKIDRYSSAQLMDILEDEGIIFKSTYNDEVEREERAKSLTGLYYLVRNELKKEGTLIDGELVLVSESRDSEFHDGGEIGVLVEIPRTGQLFLARGVYSSWDSPYWDGYFHEAVEKTRTIVEYYYEFID